MVRAVRGATSVPEDTREAIFEATSELLAELMERNGLTAADLISIIFTATDDLSAAFPAVAAREMGLTEVPLLCAREMPVPGSLPSCIRVLAHCHMDPGRAVRHVYIREARVLRTDLAGEE